MIHKDREDATPADKFERAGQDAERQMAFYLRRAFNDAPDIFVLNDLRLTRNGEVAQIDHLIIHKFGMIIIESKSSHGVIKVNAHREFSRVHSGRTQGMPSPIEQAGRQGELLRDLLQDHRESLRNKYIAGRLQGGFKGCHIQLLVAISDSGRIEGAREAVPELFKADRIPQEARKIIDRHQRAGSFTSVVIDAVRGKDLDKGWGEWWFAADEMPRVVKFLLDHHESRAPAPPPAALPTVRTAAPAPPRPAAPPSPRRPAAKPAPAKPAPVPPPQREPAPSADRMPTYLCTKCESTNLDLVFARSYYFKCRDCGGNTPIRNVCRTCNQLTRTTKRRSEYFCFCDTCKTETLFFVSR